MIAGRRHAPSSFAATPLEEVLPVAFDPSPTPVESSARVEAFRPTLTRDGERSEMLALADTPEESLKVWRDLPGFHWSAPATRLRPGAVALLARPGAEGGGAGGGTPILASHQYGKGMVLFLGADETWRWRYNAGDRHFARFWGQVVYRVGMAHLLGAPRRVRLALERAENTLGRPGHVYARLLDADFRPSTRERVAARLEPLDAEAGGAKGRPVTLEAVPGQPGEYRALLANDAVGRFALRVDDPEPATLEYRVDLPPRHEMEVAGMDEDALRAAAAAGGGRFYREEDLHRLAASIAPRKAGFATRREFAPPDPLALALFVALVTAEWTLRKFSNLS